MRTFTIAFALLFVSSSTFALADHSYDATTVSWGHGFLNVIDASCQAHNISSTDTHANAAWANSPTNVHIDSTTGRFGLEIATSIYPRSGPNFFARCHADDKTFGTYVDGVITQWGDGNAFGAFSIRTTAGADRAFQYIEGLQNPVRINGNRVTFACDNAPHVRCPDLNAILTPGKTKVRVFYKIVDSASGTAVEPTNIVVLR